MRNLSSGEMLAVWEQGLGCGSVQKALLLVAVAGDLNPSAAAELSLGVRDGFLLSLRKRLFGSRLVNNAVCPACGERIEWEQDIGELIVTSPELPDSGRFMLEHEDYNLSFRLPNSLDMASIEGIDDVSAALRYLLQNCVLSAEHAGADCAVEQLPEAVVDKLSRCIETLDPQAEIRIDVSCPKCVHRWEVFFEIAEFLWSELDEWAERMLYSIHKLAHAYGWTESEILNLSPVRRQLYLGMIGG